MKKTIKKNILKKLLNWKKNWNCKKNNGSKVLDRKHLKRLEGIFKEPEPSGWLIPPFYSV